MTVDKGWSGRTQMTCTEPLPHPHGKPLGTTWQQRNQHQCLTSLMLPHSQALPECVHILLVIEWNSYTEKKIAVCFAAPLMTLRAHWPLSYLKCQSRQAVFEVMHESLHDLLKVRKWSPTPGTWSSQLSSHIQASNTVVLECCFYPSLCLQDMWIQKRDSFK